MATKTKTAKPSKLDRETLWESAIEKIREVVIASWKDGKDGWYSYVFIQPNGEVKSSETYGLYTFDDNNFYVFSDRQNDAISPDEDENSGQFTFTEDEQGDYLSSINSRLTNEQHEALIKEMAHKLKDGSMDGYYARIDELDQSQIDRLLAAGYERASYSDVTDVGSDLLNDIIVRVTDEMRENFDEWFENTLA